jgi:hypothetical protein
MLCSCCVRLLSSPQAAFAAKQLEDERVRIEVERKRKEKQRLREVRQTLRNMLSSVPI